MKMKDRESIWQKIISKHRRTEWIVVQELIETEINSGDLGQTGKH